MKSMIRKDIEDVAWQEQIRVLISDGSASLRVTLRKMIESDSGIRVVDIARSGAEAVDKTLRLRPDVVVMGLHMPILDGLDALKDIVNLHLAPVIMIAGANLKDTQLGVEAIVYGAFDFISGPDGSENLHHQTKSIILKIKQAASANVKINPLSPTKCKKINCNHTNDSKDFFQVKIRPTFYPNFGFKAVALGISTGGPKSIFKVLPYLPAHLNAAIFVIQHMPASFITTFAQRIDTNTKLPCHESQDGMIVEPGTIYVGKGGSHLELKEQGNGQVVIQQSPEPKHLFMPSVDITMQSVCKLFGAHTVGVLMTGMGRDGALGMSDIQNAGGMTIVENQDTAIVFGMPQEAIKLGAAQRVVPNYEIAGEIVKAVNVTHNGKENE
jgi:two-component system, chemotaxis family, protein-glutamate methylesterase/glutaminase